VVTETDPDLENNIPQLWLPPNDSVKWTNYSADTSKWVMINQDGTGYYRVLYEPELAQMIKNQLETNASVITPLSRSQLLDDYFTLVFRGKN
jgi:hypothetical protein